MRVGIPDVLPERTLVRLRRAQQQPPPSPWLTGAAPYKEDCETGSCLAPQIRLAAR